MGRVLISFLGRGPYLPDGQRRSYYKARYEFADWVSDEVSFFLAAALDWLRTQHESPPDQLVVLGTAGSMWDELLSALCAGGDGPDRDRVDALYLELIEPVDNQCVTPDQASRVARELSQALGVDVRAELIPAGQDAVEQAEILAALQRDVQEEDDVYLDVTHGFRHQPMLALGAAVLLSQVRRVRIRDILYGANDMRPQGDGPTPVISLRWLLDLLDWAASLQQLRTGGSLRVLPRVIHDPELASQLSETAFLLATNQVHAAGQAATGCRQTLAKTAADPILNLTRHTIDELLQELADCQRDARGILAVARSAIREQAFVQAAVLLEAAAEKHVQATGRQLDPQKLNQIAALRNALAHARRRKKAQAPQPVVDKAFSSRTQMQKTLHEQLEWLTRELT